MKKNALFLSAGITTFILVVLAVLFLKVRTIGLASSVAAASDVPIATDTLAPTYTPLPTDTVAPTSTATSQFISPQEAVEIASNALGNYQVYSVDTEIRYGKDVYKVTFSSGHVVYVNPEGVILAINNPPSAYVAPTPDQQDNPTPKKSKDTGGGGSDDGGGDDGEDD